MQHVWKKSLAVNIFSTQPVNNFKMFLNQAAAFIFLVLWTIGILQMYHTKYNKKYRRIAINKTQFSYDKFLYSVNSVWEIQTKEIGGSENDEQEKYWLCICSKFPLKISRRNFKQFLLRARSHFKGVLRNHTNEKFFMIWLDLVSVVFTKIWQLQIN